MIRYFYILLAVLLIGGATQGSELSTLRELSSRDTVLQNLALDSLTNIDEELGHVPKHSGENWFVATDGDDGATGKHPDEPFLTITFAESQIAVDDVITIEGGTYTEDVTLNLNNVTFVGEAGVILIGTLTVSSNGCVIDNINIQPSGAVGLLLSGDDCRIENVNIAGTPTTAFDIDGEGNFLTNSIAFGYTVTGFDISESTNHLKDVTAHGSGGATRGFYFTHADADENFLDDCHSLNNATASFHMITGVSGVHVVHCTSGGSDGRWIDIDETSEFVDFHFRDRIENKMTVITGAATTSYNLFQVTGTINVLSIIGIVKTVLAGSNTNCFIDLFSTNGSDAISKVTTLTLGAALKGSMIARVDKASRILSFVDASAPVLTDEIDAISESFRLTEDRTGGAHVDTFIRFVHTKGGAASGVIHWYVEFDVVSEDGWLTTVP